MKIPRIKRRLIIIIGSIVAILLIWVGVDYFILSKPSPTESPPAEQPVAQLTAPQGRELTTAKPPLTVEQKIESLTKAVADVCTSGESKEVTLVFTETEANDRAAKQLAQAEIPEDIPLEIKGVYLDFQAGNNVLTEVETTAYGVTVTIKVKSQVSIEQGKLTVQVTDVGVPLLLRPLKGRITDLVRQKVEDLVSQLTEAALGCNGKVDVEYTDIDIQEEEATITVIIKPSA